MDSGKMSCFKGEGRMTSQSETLNVVMQGVAGWM